MSTLKDIFGESDSEDEEEQPSFSRLKKGGASRGGAAPTAQQPEEQPDDEGDEEGGSLPQTGKQKKVVIHSTGSRLKKKQKKESKKRAREEDAGNAYDSEGEVEATAEDEAFIDKEGDDEELLKEYASEKQNFNDEEADNEFEQEEEPSSKKRSGSKIDESTPLGQALVGMRKKKSKEMSQDDKDRICMKLLGSMNDAYIEDAKARGENQPALRKLELLPTVKRVFNQRALHATLLEFDALVVICDWMRPLADGALPSLAIRTAMLQLMQPLPAQPEHLKKLTDSGTNVGRVVMKCSRDQRETPSNRRLARKLIEAWSRPVVGRGVSYKNLEAQQEQELGNVAGSAARVDHSKDDVDAVVDALRTDESLTSSRVRVPQFRGFDFVVRPTTNSAQLAQRRGGGASGGGGSTRSSGGGSIANRYNPESAKGRIAKKVKTRTKAT